MIPFIQEVKSSIPLIELNLKGGASVRVTTQRSIISWGGHLYFPEPAIEVELPPRSGGLRSEACKILIPQSKYCQSPGLAILATQLASPRECADLEVVVSNILVSGPDQSSVEYLFRGLVQSRTRNPKGKLGQIQLEAVPEWLLYLDQATLGARCDATCGYTYGGLGCGVDVDTFLAPADYGFPGRIRKINVIGTFFPNTSSRQVDLTVNGTAHPGALPSVITSRPKGWWVRGFLEKDGLRISISDWRWNTTLNTGTNTFILNRIPPLSWLNAELVLHPGCQRTAQACADRNNSENFGGYGYGIPAYNPVLEFDGS